MSLTGPPATAPSDLLDLEQLGHLANRRTDLSLQPDGFADRPDDVLATVVSDGECEV